MTQFNGMPDNPGDPDNTDPEATSADRAEEAAAEAADAQSAAGAEAQADAEADAAEEAVLDPTLEADVDEALADVEGDVDPDTAGEPNLEAQLAERTEDLQRLNAEYTNYRRRTERERQSVIDNAKAQVIAQLLPILDDLELARQHGDLEDGPLKSMADKLNNVLQGQKLAAFGEEGDAFDPEIHEAVQDLSSGDEKVLGTVLRRGYRVGDRLVRNAMVIIADPSDSSASADEADGGADSHGSEQS